MQLRSKKSKGKKKHSEQCDRLYSRQCSTTTTTTRDTERVATAGSMFEWTYLLALIIPTGVLSILSKIYYPKAYYYTKPIPVIILLSPLFNLDLIMRLFSKVSFHTFLYTFIVSGLIFGLIGDILLLFPSLFLQVKLRI